MRGNLIALNNDLINYLLARLIPGVLALINLLVVLRALDATQFGIYALVVTSIGLLSVMFIEWLKAYVLKLLAEEGDLDFWCGLTKRYLTMAALVLMAIILVFSLFIGLMGINFLSHSYILMAGALLFWVRSRFEINLTILNATFKSAIYLKQRLVRNSLQLVMYLALFFFEIDSANWFVCALALSYIFVAAMDRSQFRVDSNRGLIPSSEDWRSLIPALRFGFPVSIALAVDWLVNASDKYLLSIFLDLDSVGRYAAISEILLQTLTLLFIIPRLALYPKIVSAAQMKTRTLMLELFELLGCMSFWCGLVAILACILFPLELAVNIWGDHFTPENIHIFRLLVIGIVMFGVKTFLIDSIFHVYDRTRDLLITSGIVALANVLLGLALIPSFGIEGAAISSLISFAIGMFLSLHMAVRIDASCLYVILRSGMINALVLGVAFTVVLTSGFVDFFAFIVIAVMLIVVQVLRRRHLLATRSTEL